MGRDHRDDVGGVQQGGDVVHGLDDDPTVTMDLTLRVRPAVEDDAEAPGPIPMPADRPALEAAEDDVLAWLDDRPEHRALFALDQERALRTAAPDLFDAGGRSGRRRRRVAPTTSAIPGVRIESLEVEVDREEC